MGGKAKVSLYRLFIVGGKHRYVPIVRKGRSWAPKTEPNGTPGSYYLLKNGRRCMSKPSIKPPDPVDSLWSAFLGRSGLTPLH